MRIDVMYWSLKFGREWATHPEFQKHMLEQCEKLQKALEVGGEIHDAICVDDLPPPGFEGLFSK